MVDTTFKTEEEDDDLSVLTDSIVSNRALTPLEEDVQTPDLTTTEAKAPDDVPTTTDDDMRVVTDSVVEANKMTNIAAAMNNAANKDRLSPEQFKAAQQAADYLGIDLITAARQPRQTKTAVHIREMQEFLKKYPRLSKFLADPTNNILVQDDLPALGVVINSLEHINSMERSDTFFGQFEGYWEEQWLKMKAVARTMRENAIESVRHGVNLSPTGATREEILMNLQSDTFENEYKKEIEEAEKNLTEERQEEIKVLEETIDTTTEVGQREFEGKRQKIILEQRDDNTGYTEAKLTIEEERRLDNKARQIIRSAVDPNTFGRYVRDGSQAIIDIAPTVIATLVTKNPLLGSGYFAPLVYGQRFDEARARGFTVGQANAEGVFFAAVEVTTEWLPLGSLIKKVKKGKGRKLGSSIQEGKEGLLKKLFVTGGLEAGQEVFVEAVDIGYSLGILNEEMTFGEGARALFDAGVIGWGVGTTLRLGSEGIYKLAEKLGIDEALILEENVTEAQKAVAATETISNSPETMEEFIEENQEEENKSVYIDAQTLLDLHQDDILTDSPDGTPSRAAAEAGQKRTVVEQMGLDLNFVTEEAQRGGDVEVPISSVLTLGAINEKLFQTIAPKIRKSVDSMNKEEADAALAQREEDVADVLTAMQEEQAKDPEVQPIYETVRAQLESIGVNPEEADATATLYQERYTARAENFDGVTAEELFLEENVSIRRPAQKDSKAATSALQQASKSIPTQEGGGSTQVATTAQSYPKIVAAIEKKIGKKINHVLDYGAGLGLGTDAMRAAGKRVHSYEPDPARWQGKRKPDFTDSAEISKQYDLVMLMNVLNVLEKDLRDIVLDDVISKIAYGGQAVIGVRGWKGDIEKTKSKKNAREKNAIWVEKKGERSYQKGFDGDDLIKYVKSRLPAGYTVEKFKAGKNGVVIRRNTPHENKVLNIKLNQNMPDPKENEEGIVAEVQGQYGKVQFETLDRIADLKDLPWFDSLQDLVNEDNPVVLMPTVADRTSTGAVFTGIDDDVLQMAIPLLGGPLFPLRLTNLLNNIIWADKGKGVDSQKRNMLLEQGVTHIIVMLGGNDMHISNTTIGQAFFQTLTERINKGEVNKTQLRKIKKYFRTLEFTGKDPKQKVVVEQLKTFVGFDSLFDGTNGMELLTWLHEVSFETRKQLMERLSNREIESLHGVNMQKILNATREPSLNTVDMGMGAIILEIDRETFADGSVDINHPDYPTGMHGKLTGILRNPINWRLLNQDWLEQNRKEKREATGRDPYPHEEYRAWTGVLPAVTITQELVDRIGDVKTPNIDGAMQARIVLSLLSTETKGKHSDETLAKDGGVKNVNYRDAAKASTGDLVLIPEDTGGKDGLANRKDKKGKAIPNSGFNAKVKMGNKGEVGGYQITHLGYTGKESQLNTEIFSLIEITPKGKSIVSLINNETGTDGIAYTALILDALDKGATLSVAEEGTAEYTMLTAFGFEPNADGQLEFKGENDGTETYTERYIRGGTAAVLTGRVDPDVQSDVDQLRQLSKEKHETGAHELRGTGIGERGLREVSLSSRARQIAESIAKLPDSALENLNLTTEDRASVANIIDNAYNNYQQESRKLTSAEIEHELETIGLVTDEAKLGFANGFPEYLKAVASFITKQRSQKLITGELTVRDLAKAYAITVASQGAGAMKVKNWKAKTGFNPSEVFVDRDMIRPEEAAAMWFGTENGQKALSELEKGNLDPELWQELYAWRKAFGDNRLVNQGFPNSLKDLESLVLEFNELGKAAGRGENIVDAIETAAKKLNGVAFGKAPFFNHLLGFGEGLTLDAVEINYWLSGKADVKGLKGKQKELINKIKQSPKGKLLLRDMIMSQLNDMKADLNLPEDINENVFMHIMHHWLWDSAKDIETTHKGLYEAMTLYQDGAAVELLPEEKLEKKYTHWGVGKSIGGNVYIHKSAMDALPKPILNRIKKAKIPRGHKWEVIKYNKKNGNISLIESPDWKTADEPISGDSIIIKKDGSIKLRKMLEDPQIYHHKWLFVHDNYKGFDIAESRMRSRIWKALPDVDTSIIGFKSKWEKNVVPRIAPNKLAQKGTSPVGPRGSFYQEADKYGNISNIIELTKNANKSTFLHESGHFWLHQLVKDAADPRLTEEGREKIKQDLAATKKWFKKNAGQAWTDIKAIALSAKNAAAKDPDNIEKRSRAERLEAAVKVAKEKGGIKYMRDIADTFMEGKLDYATELEVAYHELWARGTEKYFADGQAPTTALQQAFQNFSAWLVGIYKDLMNLRVKLDDEITSVFDRLLTTEEALQDTLQTDALNIPDALIDVATESEKQALTKLAKEAKAEARKQVQKKVMDGIKREKSAQRREAEKRIKKQVTKEVGKMPIYAALRIIRKGIMPDGTVIEGPDGQRIINLLDRKEVIKVYGAETARKISKHHRNVFVKKGAASNTDISTVAAAAGFRDADEMIEALSEGVLPEAELISSMTNERLIADLGEVLTDADISEMATDAVLNDKQLDVLAAQARILRRLAEPPLQKIAERQVQDEGAPTAAESRAAVDAAKEEVQADITSQEGRSAVGLKQDVVGTRSQLDLTSAQQKQKEDVKGRKAQKAAKRRVSEILRGVSMDVIKETARRHIQRLSLSELNPNKFRAAADRIGKKFAKAVAARDYALAEELLQQVSLNLALAKEAAAVKEKLLKQATQMGTFLSKTDKKIAKSYDVDVVNLMRNLMFSVGIGKPNKQNLPVEEALALMEQAEVELYTEISKQIGLIESDIANSDYSGRNGFRKMSVDKLTELFDLMSRLKQEARDNVRYTVEGEAIEFEEIEAEIKAITGDRTPSQIIEEKDGEALGTADTTMWRKFKDKLLTWGANMRRMELWSRWADNDLDRTGDGPFTKYFFKPIQLAVDKYNEKRKLPIGALLEILKDKQDMLSERINIKAQEIGWKFETKGQLIHALLHTGNLSNLRKLLLGGQVDSTSKTRVQFGKENEFGELDTSSWDLFIKRMHDEGVLTKEDWDLVQNIWDIFEFTKGEAQIAHKQMHGYNFTEIPDNPVETPFGTYKGGYVPAIFDPVMTTDTNKHLDAEALGSQGSAAMFPSPQAGFTKQRVEYNESLLLDLAIIPAHLDKVLRFAYIAPAVRRVGKLAFNKKIKGAIGLFSKNGVDTIIVPWLERTVLQRVTKQSTTESSREWDNILKQLNKNIGYQTMMFNISNTIQQFTGLTTAMVVVKPRHLMRALFQWRQDNQQIRQYVQERSAFMATRMLGSVNDAVQTIDEILRDTTPIGKVHHWANKYAYVTQQFAQNMMDPSVWLAAENQAREEGLWDTVFEKYIGLGEAEATRRAEQAVAFYADSVVRDTQTPMTAEAISGLEYGTALSKLFLKFYSYFNNIYNLNKTQYQLITNQIGWKGKPNKLFYLYMMGIAAPSILAEGVAMGIRGEFDEDNEEETTKVLFDVLVGSQIRFGLAMIPVAGPTVMAFWGQFTKETFDDKLSLSPVISIAGQDIAGFGKVVYKWFSPDKDVPLSTELRKTLDILGTLFGLPTRWWTKPTTYFLKVQEGTAVPNDIQDIVTGILTGRDQTER